ncbi:DnaD domain protein [Acetobacterium tundrae]|uniref:DnaD domain protein n=1 Tax=Acetobacterium tundrae TaxID=132932 RepID=A0ABR6WL62_9FIRM|nr:DnaD domain protein [Acetobacterium tundrae]MBC3797008.1 DnaD domain protein [Acetobacterium tundrae]
MNRFELVSSHDDLGVTPIENIFINHYMPMAQGDYVKVYLYGLKRCFNQGLTPISNEDIAKDLNLLETDVKKAWDYWASEKIISIEYTGTRDALVRFFNITGTMLYKNEEVPKTTVPRHQNSTDTLEDRIGRMYETIQDMYESRTISRKETQLFKHWLSEYNFTPEAVILIVEYSLNMINKKDRTFTPAQVISYLETVAKSFYTAEVRDHLEAEAYIKESAQKRKSYYQIFKYLGIQRNPMVSERKMMDIWFFDYGFSMEIIVQALSRTNKPNLKYIDGILKNWHEQGFKTLEDIKNDKPKPRKAVKETVEPMSDSRKQAYLDMEVAFTEDLWPELEVDDENL